MKVLLIILINVFTYLMISCQNWDISDTKTIDVDPDNFTIQVSSTEDTIELCWRVPEEHPQNVEYYEVYYRQIGTDEWYLVKSKIPASDSPSVVIKREELKTDAKEFEFGILSVSELNFKSDMHASSDTNGSLNKGWFLHWE